MFYVAPGGSLTLLNLTISGGLNTNGGAIYNDTGGTLIISNCVFTGNTATNYAGVAGANATSQGNINGGNGGDGLSAAGGAIFSQGTLEVYYSIFNNNTVSAGNGGNGGNGIQSFVFGGNAGNGGSGGSAQGGAIVCTGPHQYFCRDGFHGKHLQGGQRRERRHAGRGRVFWESRFGRDWRRQGGRRGPGFRSAVHDQLPVHRQLGVGRRHREPEPGRRRGHRRRTGPLQFHQCRLY